MHMWLCNVKCHHLQTFIIVFLQDETLFASKSAKAKFAESQGATVGHGRRAPQNNINAQGKDTIEIVTKDGIRKLM